MGQKHLLQVSHFSSESGTLAAGAAVPLFFKYKIQKIRCSIEAGAFGTDPESGGFRIDLISGDEQTVTDVDPDGDGLILFRIFRRSTAPPGKDNYYG